MTHCLFTKKCTNSHFLFEKLLIVIFYLKGPNYNIFNKKLKQNFFLYEKIQIATFLNKKVTKCTFSYKKCTNSNLQNCRPL